MAHYLNWLTPILFTALAFSAGCKSNDNAPSNDGSELDIAGGALDWGHPSVGSLAKNGKTFCTGTLISKYTVLTAAHCGEMAQAKEITFTVGGKGYIGASYIKHPEFSRTKIDTDEGHDVGLIILSSPVTNVTPAPLSTWKPWKWQKITIVGFGDTEKGNDSGKKRYATTTIANVETRTFTFTGTKNTRPGDSGGPTFSVENGKTVVSGVHHAYDDKINRGRDMSVTYYRKWITENMDKGAGQMSQPFTVSHIDVTPIAGDHYTVKGTAKLSITAKSAPGVTQVQFLIQCDSGYFFGFPGTKQGNTDKFAGDWNTLTPSPAGPKAHGRCKLNATAYDNGGAHKAAAERKIQVIN